MDDLIEIYRRIEYLRNNGLKMKEIADFIDMAPMPNICRSIGADDTHARTEDNQEWHDGNQTENFR